MDNETMVFTALKDEGEEVECEALFSFESTETKKKYIAYTDNSVDEDGSLRVFASIYESTEEGVRLLPIETEKEWQIIEIILNEIQDEVNNGE